MDSTSKDKLANATVPDPFDCPTGLLIDLSSPAVQGPLPNQFFDAGKFDDTFGIYNNNRPSLSKQSLSKSVSTNNAKKGGLGTKGVDKLIDTEIVAGIDVVQIEDDIQEAELSGIMGVTNNLSFLSNSNSSSPFGFGFGSNSSGNFSKGDLATTPKKGPKESTSSSNYSDPFSPICTSKSTSTERGPFSPLPKSVVKEKPRRSDGSCSESNNGNDSFLDLENLSAFSASDSEDLFEEILTKIAEEGNQEEKFEDSILPLTLNALPTPTRNYLSNGSVGSGADLNLENQDAEKRRRDSISSKLNRLSLLISNPAPVSPTSTSPIGIGIGTISNYTATQNPLTTPGASAKIPQSVGIRTPQSTVSTMTSPCSKVSTFPRGQPLPRIPASPDSSCNRYMSFAKPKNYGTSTITTVDVDRNDDDRGESIRAKRLSFGSTSSESCCSPLKSSRDHPNFSSKSKPAPTMKHIAPKLQRASSIRSRGTQPLKAVPLSSDSRLDSAEIRKVGCASAPVTRKFMTPPPKAAQSPGASRHNSSVTGTPTSARKSFNSVRSSGYGQQQSFNTSINSNKRNQSVTHPESPERNITTPKRHSASSKVGNITPTGSSMGVRGQLSNSFNSTLTGTEVFKQTDNIVKKAAIISTEKICTETGIRRSASTASSKENRPVPKIRSSALPRPGFGFGFGKM